MVVARAVLLHIFGLEVVHAFDLAVGLLNPTISFLLAVLLFPEPMEDGLNFKSYYYANHRWFFALAALLAPIDAVDTLLKG